MTEAISFGEWLRKQRRALDLTRQVLANQVGCAEITLRRIENETLKPSKELAQILLEKLGISEFERQQWILFARGLSGFPTSPIDSFVTKSSTNLPASLTTFIGREKEQADIIKHIRKYRLVTLTGPGGVGKTRLSIKVGEQVSADYVNGVWLVELAALNDPDLVPQTILVLFGIAAQTKTSSTEILINFLRAKTILLILDNCEHVLEACAQLADKLLKNCPNLKILSTSRESLGITGEAAYPVPSLGLPDLEQLLENFREYESVRLFEERAQLTKLDFALTLENASSVAQICHRLDGIPLAIELAAAHINMFSTEQIATKLTESFNLLTGGSRTALPRQQTIRASIEWSWNLLSDSERILLRRLSVFAGGWTIEAAESVCSKNGIEKNLVMDLMSQLMAKSLVVANQESGRERRYHLLETIREYASEKLIEANEQDTIRIQHLRYFLELSEQAESALKGPEQLKWLEHLHLESYNIRAALEWAAKTDVESGLSLSSGLSIRFWESFDLQEGNKRFTEFLDRPESRAYPRARAKALYVHGVILALLYQRQQARSAAEECLALYRACGDQHGEIDGLIILARTIFILGDAIQPVELAQQALALAESLGDTWRKAVALLMLGYCDLDLPRALFHLEKAIPLFRQLKDWWGLSRSLDNAAGKAMLNGNIHLAEQYLTESISLSQKLNNKASSLNRLIVYGHIAFARGDYEQARASIQESIELCQEVGNRMQYLWSRAYLGYIKLGQGDIAEARAIFSETIHDFQSDDIEIGIIYILEGMASLSVAVGDTQKAARLIGLADETREKINDLRPPIEQADMDKTIKACLAKLGEGAFSDEYEKGKKMSLEEAVALALEEN